MDFLVLQQYFRLFSVVEKKIYWKTAKLLAQIASLEMVYNSSQFLSFGSRNHLTVAKLHNHFNVCVNACTCFDVNVCVASEV